MNVRNASLLLVICCALAATSCQSQSPGSADGSNATAVGGPGPLPDNGFKASISLIDPPAKLRTGEKQTVQVKVRNGSDVMWYARGAAFNRNPDNRYYLATGNRWLKADDESLISDMDGRYGLNRDLKPGGETEVPLVVTAPKEPGEYILEVDLVQEQVAWFRDKGSATARTKITVVR